MKRLKAYLKARHESQVAFSRRLGVSQAVVNQWLAGTRRPSVRMLQRIAEATRLTMEELLDLPLRRANKKQDVSTPPRLTRSAGASGE